MSAVTQRVTYPHTTEVETCGMRFYVPYRVTSGWREPVEIEMAPESEWTLIECSADAWDDVRVAILGELES